MKSLFDLEGMVCAVTGGGGVLGSEICRGLARSGARVAVLNRSPETTQKVADQITTAGGEALAVPCDVLDKDGLEAARETILARFGRLDGLINGAGGNKPLATTSPERSFFDLPQDAVGEVFDLNFQGTLLPCQVFGPVMVAQGTGVILNVSSMAAFSPLTRVTAYSAAKSAVNNFTRWLAVHMAQEYSPDIRVNAIAPGFFLTEQNRFLLTNQDGGLTERGQQIIDHTPIGRFGDPADLVGTVVWLLSPAAAFVTGVVVPVDGGFSAFGGV
jgi:NAD(P)-dependent dehydrogenase (short-subunit alcohol dehydrogenase family)